MIEWWSRSVCSVWQDKQRIVVQSKNEPSSPADDHGSMASMLHIRRHENPAREACGKIPEYMRMPLCGAGGPPARGRGACSLVKGARDVCSLDEGARDGG
jgi:hypothetical protein